MAEEWYGVVEDDSLAQGDILRNCPLPQIANFEYPLSDQVTVSVAELDLVILSQSCDLENDKVDEVLLAALHSYRQLCALESESNPALLGKNWRKQVIDGNQPAYSLIPERTVHPVMDWSLVDFHHLFTVPKAYLEGFCREAGPRLRLLPPYREHLAQAFARYVMRVGLPAPFDAFRNLTI